MDAGCGSDLISEVRASKLKTRAAKVVERITFSTANGNIASEKVALTRNAELGCNIDAQILPDTPSVLSIGRRCTQEGYAFVWPPGGKPYFVLPDGRRMFMHVLRDIPYLCTGADECQPFDPNPGMVIPTRAVPQDRVRVRGKT